MKVWEAIELLQSMDGNKEVTVTMGKAKVPNPDQEIFPSRPATPYIIPRGALFPLRPDPFWPPNTITCKL